MPKHLLISVALFLAGLGLPAVHLITPTVGWWLVGGAAALLVYDYLRSRQLSTRQAQERDYLQASLRLTSGEGAGVWEPPYMIHKVTVVNDEPAPARNVQLSITRIMPEQPPLYRVNVPIHLMTFDIIDQNVPKECELVKSWVNQDGVVHASWYGVKGSPKIPMQPNDLWEVAVTASADNAEDTSCTFTLTPQTNSARLQRK